MAETGKVLDLNIILTHPQENERRKVTMAMRMYQKKAGMVGKAVAGIKTLVRRGIRQ